MNDLRNIIFHILMGYVKGESHCFSVFQPTALKQLVKSVNDIFVASPIRLTLSGDFIVVGDIHGDLGCLVRIFQKFGFPPEKNYLFLGDYIDRGSNSLEVILLLYALKLLFPNNVALIRGNHESAQTSKNYGFRDDCMVYLSRSVYHNFIESFSNMPLCAVLNSSIFCVHGGISKHFSKLKEIDSLERPLSKYNDDLFIDLLWSDPSESISKFGKSDRGLGHFFGESVFEQFLEKNGLKMMIRGHECHEKGYMYNFSRKNCLTVFSASNYCEMGNDSSVAIVSNDSVDIELFERTIQKEKLIFPIWIFEGIESMEDPIDESIEKKLFESSILQLNTLI